MDTLGVELEGTQRQWLPRLQHAWAERENRAAYMPSTASLQHYAISDTFNLLRVWACPHHIQQTEETKPVTHVLSITFSKTPCSYHSHASVHYINYSIVTSKKQAVTSRKQGDPDPQLSMCVLEVSRVPRKLEVVGAGMCFPEQVLAFKSCQANFLAESRLTLAWPSVKHE